MTPARRRVIPRTKPRQAGSAASLDRWHREIARTIHRLTKLLRSLDRAERR